MNTVAEKRKRGTLERCQKIRLGRNKSGTSRVQVRYKSEPSQEEEKNLQLCKSEKTLAELMTALGRKSRHRLRSNLIDPLLEKGWLEMTIPEKPNSRSQKYRLTKIPK